MRKRRDYLNQETIPYLNYIQLSSTSHNETYVDQLNNYAKLATSYYYFKGLYNINLHVYRLRQLV